MLPAHPQGEAREPLNVCIEHAIHLLPQDADYRCIQRLMLAAPRPKPVGEAEEVRLVDGVEHFDHGLLQELILQCRDSERSVPSRPFDVTEYAETAHRISQAAVNPSGLLSHIQETLDSPSLTRLTPEVEALLVETEERAQRWLYTPFALGCGLIVYAGIAVILTVWALSRYREVFH